MVWIDTLNAYPKFPDEDAVKNPYRASNKRQPTDQIIKTVSNNILLSIV